MPIGSSLGNYYEDAMEMETAAHRKKESDAAEIAANETSNDFQSRFYATDQSTMPPGASTELAGALKQKGGTQTPDKVAETNFSYDLGKEALKTVDAAYEWKLGLNKRLGDSVVSGLTLPGDVASGKVQMTDESGHTSPQVIERSMDLAGLMVTGPAPVASKMVDGTLGSFAGVRGKTLNKSDLGYAQILEANGVHPDDVFTTTGMFRGADNKWRYEIPDSPSKMDPFWANKAPNLTIEQEHALPRGQFEQVPFEPYPGKVTAKLPEVLDHPELYKAYPELRDVSVVHEPNLGAHAQWDTTENALKLSTPALADKATLMHEIQHAIQGIEGFAKGGAPASTSEGVYKLKYQSPVEELLPRYSELANKYADYAEGGAALPRKELIELAHLSRVMKKYREYVSAANKEATANYERLSGEVEARNVATRAELPVKFARNVSPLQTEDVTRARQININEPAWTTPYGIIDPKTGKTIKPRSQDIPGSFTPYSNRWPNNDNARLLNEHEQFIQDYDKLHAFGEKITKKGNWHEINVHKYNKMGRELAKSQGGVWEDVAFEPFR